MKLAPISPEPQTSRARQAKVENRFICITTAMSQRLVRFIVDAAPSVALATLAMTIVFDGSSYAAIEGSSMMAGALAFFIYASLVSRIMM
jgi:hypothetical protein